jgi:hypothetical protein
MNQKLWGNENFERSWGNAGKCWNQPAWVNHINPKRWATGRKRFEKSPLKVSSPIFEVAPTLGRVKSSIPHEAWRFYFFSKKI